jgi:2-C-methyl-D-erythritol 4-phosphate cytidylyltransferase
MVGAVIVGAGEGKRMGASGRKQFVKIAGKPLIAYTLDVFERSALIDHIVIVVPMDSIDLVKEDVVSAYGMKKVHAVVYGGATRQESVFNGLKALKPGMQQVVIHDAVRPLVSDTLIRRVLDASQKTGAAITAVPAKDTVKRVESGEIVGTLDRRLLWLAQTPQCFRYDTIMNAHTKAAAEKGEGTDDASLVERIGTKVAVAVGSYSNLKMTSPEDLPMFEYFLGQEVRAKIDSAVERSPVDRHPRHRGRRSRRRPPSHKMSGGPGREREHGRGRQPREHAKETRVAQNRDGIRHP